MAVKTYKLTSDALKYIGKNDEYKFRLGFSKTLEDGKILICSQRRCPVISLKKDMKISTSNEFAQLNIEKFILPFKSKRNSEGCDYMSMVFEEYLDDSLDADNTLDLDPFFIIDDSMYINKSNNLEDDKEKNNKEENGSIKNSLKDKSKSRLSAEFSVSESRPKNSFKNTKR